MADENDAQLTLLGRLRSSLIEFRRTLADRRAAEAAAHSQHQAAQRQAAAARDEALQQAATARQKQRDEALIAFQKVRNAEATGHERARTESEIVLYNRKSEVQAEARRRRELADTNRAALIESAGQGLQESRDRATGWYDTQRGSAEAKLEQGRQQAKADIEAASRALDRSLQDFYAVGIHASLPAATDLRDAELRGRDTDAAAALTRFRHDAAQAATAVSATAEALRLRRERDRLVRYLVLAGAPVLLLTIWILWLTLNAAAQQAAASATATSVAGTAEAAAVETGTAEAVRVATRAVEQAAANTAVARATEVARAAARAVSAEAVAQATARMEATLAARPSTLELLTQADGARQSAGLYVRRNETVFIDFVSGTRTTSRCNYTATAGGDPTVAPLDWSDNVIGGCQHGKPIGRIDGAAFCIGSGITLDAGAAGILESRLNDAVTNDNGGSFVMNVGPR